MGDLRDSVRERDVPVVLAYSMSQKRSKVCADSPSASRHGNPQPPPSEYKCAEMRDRGIVDWYVVGDDAQVVSLVVLYLICSVAGIFSMIVGRFIQLQVAYQ